MFVPFFYLLHIILELGVFKKVTLPKKAATELLFPDLKSPTTPVFLEGNFDKIQTIMLFWVS